MAGIKNLNEIFQKKGKDFTENLFNSDLTITENLDGSAFSFEKDFVGDKISFYKKDQSNPITKVDRILMSYYEKPILYIESLPEDIKEDIPVGWRFGMLYFPNTKPVRIEYERIPKNHLILTHITVRNEFGETEESIQDSEKLNEWADKLGVERPPIIFQGKLNPDQKLKIMDFVSTPYMDLKDRFKTESFTKYIISILNPEIVKTTLGNDLHGEIDSIIFRFKDDEGEKDLLAKMIDPIFYEVLKLNKSKKSTYFPNDVYSLCLIDVMNYVLEIGVENFGASGDEPEERYINFVFSVFKGFVNEYGEKYIGADFDKPEYLKSDEFGLNDEMIEDLEVKGLLDDDEIYSDILQLILNSFRKFKRTPYGFFTEGLIDQFNHLVQEIADYINAKRKEQIKESIGVPTFISFKNKIRKFKAFDEDISEALNIDDESFDDYEDLNESSTNLNEEDKVEDTSEFFSFNSFKRVISTNKEKKKIKILKENNEKCNLIMGKFQPFNNGHLKMCTRVMKENNLPIYLCVVHPGEASKKYPYSESLLKKTIGGLVSENSKLFCGYKIIKENLLEEAVNNACETHNPISVSVGEEDFENAVLQREWVKKKYDIPEFEIFKTPRWADNETVRKSISDNDFQEFKSRVPKSVAILFNEYVKECSESDSLEEDNKESEDK